VTSTPAFGDLLRDLAPQVLGVLIRRHGQFDACEDAVHRPETETVDVPSDYREDPDLERSEHD
jgi:hypothetical protein